MVTTRNQGFPDGSDGKESACNAGDLGSIPRLGRPPGEGNSNPLQYSCLGNPRDRGTGGLQSMGLQRVGPDLVTKQQQPYDPEIELHLSQENKNVYSHKI